MGGSLVLSALLGLAAITLAPGIVYWLMRERDDRVAGASRKDSE